MLYAGGMKPRFLAPPSFAAAITVEECCGRNDYRCAGGVRGSALGVASRRVGGAFLLPVPAADTYRLSHLSGRAASIIRQNGVKSASRAAYAQLLNDHRLAA